MKEKKETAMTVIKYVGVVGAMGVISFLSYRMGIHNGLRLSTKSYPEVPSYNYCESIDFIASRCKIPRSVIEKVLSLEDRYLESRFMLSYSA